MAKRGKNNLNWVSTLLRIPLGLMFVIIGLIKIQDPSGIAGFLGSMGFPIPMFFAYLMFLTEIIFGATILTGYKVKYTVWPLVALLFFAVILVIIPTTQFNPPGISVLGMHILSMASLIAIYILGPGKWAISKD